MGSMVFPKTNGLDRIKLHFSFDAFRLLEEVQKMELSGFEYYDALPLRAPAHMVDPKLPFPEPSGDCADGSWTDWLDTDLLKGSNYISEVIDNFKENTTVNLVRILRLSAYSEVKEHTDPTLALEEEKSMIRLTIPVTENPECDFYLNGQVVPMKFGECWYLKLNDPHKIINRGNTERINMTIDMIPNDWIRGQIESSL